MITKYKKVFSWIFLGVLFFSLFFLIQLVFRRQTTVNQAANKRSAVASNPYKKRTTFDRYIEHEKMRRKFGDPQRLPDDKIKKIIEESKADQGEIGADPPVLKRVMLLIYDPFMISYAGQRLHTLYNWKDPEEITQRYISDIRTASYGYVNYEVVDSQIIDAFPEKSDGFIYNEETYIACNPLPVNGIPQYPNIANCHEPDDADYLQILNEYDICQKANRGEIDELWLFGGPFFGFWEAAMAGPLSHDTNGELFTDGTSCLRNVYMMGFNYEYNEVNMLHDFIHRTEGSMAYVYAGWKNRPYSAIYTHQVLTPTVTIMVTPTTAPPPYTHWDDYASTAIFPSIIPGVGTAHWPPNSKTYVSEGSFDNITPVQSSADDWTRYPNLQGTTTAISASNWEKTEHGFYLWFLSHLPHVTGKNTDNTFNNWWKYLIDMNRYYPDPPCGTPVISERFPEDNSHELGEPAPEGRRVVLRARIEPYSCIQKMHATILVRDVTAQEPFRRLCYDDNPAAQAIECTVPIEPNHDYEWSVTVSNFSRFTQSPIMHFTTSPPPCDSPSIQLWFPPDNTVFSQGTTRIALQADVIFRTCSGVRERAIYIRDASIGEDFQLLCFYTHDTEDLRFSCNADIVNNHYYQWYATASNGTHTAQTTPWRFAVGAFPTNTPTPTPITCDQEDLSACTCANADINNDCKVDIFDLTKAGACYNLPANQNSCQRADVIRDAYVRLNDICCVSICYGKLCPYNP